jgi:hypothetical protein
MNIEKNAELLSPAEQTAVFYLALDTIVWQETGRRGPSPVNMDTPLRVKKAARELVKRCLDQKA